MRQSTSLPVGPGGPLHSIRLLRGREGGGRRGGEGGREGGGGGGRGGGGGGEGEGGGGGGEEGGEGGEEERGRGGEEGGERRGGRREGEDVAAITRSWHFSDAGPITLICAQLPRRETGPLANPHDPNYTELLSYADLDALIELYGHISAENPAMDVFYKLSSNVVNADMSGHVVVLGGIAWNDKTRGCPRWPACRSGRLKILRSGPVRSSCLSGMTWKKSFCRSGRMTALWSRM